jgi:hypothetical protein
MCNLELSMALQEWCYIVHCRLARQHLLGIAIRRSQNATLSRGMLAWRHLMVRNAAARNTMQQAIRRLQNLTRLRVFTSWAKVWSNNGLAKTRFEHIARRIRLLRASRAFVRWAQTRSERKRMHNKVNVVGRRIIQDMAYTDALSTATLANDPVDEMAARQLAVAVSTGDAGTAAMSAAATVAAEFVALRHSKLRSADQIVRRLEKSLLHARETFVAVTDHAHGPQDAAGARHGSMVQLTRRRAALAAEEVLEYLEGSPEKVILKVDYSVEYGAYDQDTMLDELRGIGIPDTMADGIAAWLYEGTAEIEGELHTARVLKSQLQAVPSLAVSILPTEEQRQAASDYAKGLAGETLLLSAEDQEVLERRLSNPAEERREELISTALWDCVQVLADESDTH